MNEHDDEEESFEDGDGEEEGSNPELEAEFEEHVKKIQAKIQKHVEDAEAALNKAVELADKHGVSFYSGVSFLGQCYQAEVLPKYAELDEEFINEATGTWSEYGYGGWEHSAVC